MNRRRVGAALSRRTQPWTPGTMIPQQDGQGQPIQQMPSYSQSAMMNNPQLAQKMYQDSLTPAQPEQSWAQGAARLAQAVVATKAMNASQQSQDEHMKNYMADQQLVADYAMGKNPDVNPSMFKTPEGEQEWMKNLQERSKYNMERTDKLSDNPELQEQKTIYNLSKNANIIQSAMSQEQDPAKVAALQSQLDAINNTVKSHFENLQTMKAQYPDKNKEYANQAFDAMSNGAPLNPAEEYALHSKAMKAPETGFQKTVGAGIGSNLVSNMKQFSDSAKASQDMTNQGEEVLRAIAANPNIRSGFGTESLTKAQTFINNIFPGVQANLADQQFFQKMLGQMSLENVGQLRSHGIQRVTQSEIMNFLPIFTATLGNTKEGIQSIIELQQSMNPSMQKGAAAMGKIQDYFLSHPNDGGYVEAFNDVNKATQQEAQNAAMNYVNSKLALKGQMVIVNPKYDENSNALNKYVLVQKPPENAQAPQSQQPAPVQQQAPAEQPQQAPQQMPVQQAAPQVSQPTPTPIAQSPDDVRKALFLKQLTGQ